MLSYTRLDIIFFSQRTRYGLGTFLPPIFKKMKLMVKISLIALNTLKMSFVKKQAVKLVKDFKEIFYKGSKLAKFRKFHKKR